MRDEDVGMARSEDSLKHNRIIQTRREVDEADEGVPSRWVGTICRIGGTTGEAE